MTRKELNNLYERYKSRSDMISRATLETIIKETSETQEARIKMLLKPENYKLFFNYYFGKDTPIPMADSDSAWYHQAVYEDLYKNAYITLFNLIFRGGAKSTHANLGYPFALKQSKQAQFFLVVGINEIRASMLLQDLQVQFEHNHRIIRDFGNQKSYGNWTDGQFETTDRCTFMSLGIDQPFRGLKANGVRLEYVSIDDVEDKKRTLNTNLINEYADKVTGDIQGAFSKNSERAIINNNFFVDNGFVGTLMKRKGIDPKKLKTTENFVLKEKFVSVYLVNLTTKYYQDIESKPNLEWKPSWKERYSKEDCLRKIEQYKHDKATLSNEFYNTPIKVGKLFKPEQVEFVKPGKLSDYDLLVGFWDFSYTAQGDTKAFALIGCKPGGFTVLDVFCRNCDISVATEYHFQNTRKWFKENPNIITYYDANVSQKAIFEPILVNEAVKYKSMAIPLPTHNATDKYTKISTILGAILASGKLTFSEQIQNKADWSEASQQFFSFEKGSKMHDDFPDALAECVRQAQLLYTPDVEVQQFKPVFGKRKIGGY
jgi:hypothetical protein